MAKEIVIKGRAAGPARPEAIDKAITKARALVEAGDFSGFTQLDPLSTYKVFSSFKPSVPQMQTPPGHLLVSHQSTSYVALAGDVAPTGTSVEISGEVQELYDASEARVLWRLVSTDNRTYKRARLVVFVRQPNQPNWWHRYSKEIVFES